MCDQFKRVDQILTRLEITTSEKIIIYNFIAAILHLGNIDFCDTDFGSKVTEMTKIHVAIAARLLELSSDDLEKALLFRTIEVPGLNIW